MSTITQQENRYNVDRGVGVIFAWIALLITGASVGGLDPDMFTFGPSETMTFISIPVNSWTTWTLVSGFTMATQIAQSYISSTVGLWSLQVLDDYKTERIHMTWNKVMMVRALQLIFAWLDSLAEVMIFISAKFQFIIIMAVCDITIKLYRTTIYIEGKCSDAKIKPLPTDDPLSPEDRTSTIIT